MPRNGQGQYQIPAAAGNPVVPQTPIVSAWANPTLTDIGNALTQSVSNDGQTPMVGNLNLASNKILNLQSGTAAADAVNFGQVFTSPAFTGTPTAPTPATGNNSTQIATTQFVSTAVAVANPFYEGFTSQATAFNTIQPMDLAINQILYSTVNATNSVTINFRGTSTMPLSTYLLNSNSLSGAILLTNGAVAFTIGNWQVDGVAITPRFLFGTVIATGNANATDIYSFTILRASTGAYTLLISQQYYA